MGGARPRKLHLRKLILFFPRLSGLWRRERKSGFKGQTCPLPWVEVICGEGKVPLGEGRHPPNQHVKSETGLFPGCRIERDRSEAVPYFEIFRMISIWGPIIVLWSAELSPHPS